MKPSSNLTYLTKISARIGNDINLIQGAGGNTSLKEGNILWVKGSGKWLSLAEKENIFVGVELTKIDNILFDNGGELKPSIETSLHALMPHKFVIHVHSTSSIALSVQEQGKSIISELLSDLNWLWVPYIKPGPKLSAKIQQLSKNKKYDVLILANHGLVIGADTCVEAESLLAKVEQALNIPIEENTGKLTHSDELHALAQDSHFRLPHDEFCHSIAANSTKLLIATKGSLYPDHVVFLGSGVVSLENNHKKLINDFNHNNAPPLIALSGKGVLVRKGITKNAESMVTALARALAKLPANAQINYLSKNEENELINWDAEKYRQKINDN